VGGATYELQFGPVLQQSGDLLGGLWLTLGLSVASIVVGFIIAVICAGIRTQGPRWAASCVAAYVELIRNTPFLVQLFFVYLALPQIGDAMGLQLRLSPNIAALIALSVNLGGYATEIVRAGIDSVNDGQIQASQALGLRPLQIFRLVILPPAIERVYPALTSQFILQMLGSSLVSAVSVNELTGVANEIQSQTFRTFEVYIVTALIYFALAVTLRVLFWAIAWFGMPSRRGLAAGH
jgi:polar amino acid transport system permease protein